MLRMLAFTFVALTSAVPLAGQTGEFQIFTLAGATTSARETGPSFTIGASYRFADDWSVQLQMSRVEQEIRIFDGTNETPSFRFVDQERYPVDLGFVYQPGHGRFRPFIGAGVSWADELAIESRLLNTSDDHLGIFVLGGIDIQVHEHTSFKLSYRTLERSFDGYGIGDTLSAGIGWRF